MSFEKTYMSAYDAAQFYKLFTDHDIPVWIDGGWAVDALLGEETRRHGDLDIALRHRHVGALRKLLESLGFQDVPRDDTRECNFVLSDTEGRQIDIHTFELDADGHNTYGVAYEAAHFGGQGTIAGQRVNCINPETLVSFHAGYELDDDDHHDVMLLCEKLNIPVSEEHRNWEAKKCS